MTLSCSQPTRSLWRCLPYGVALAGLALGQVRAQTTAPPAPPRFQVAVQAPPPLDALLKRHLELLRFQQVPDLSPFELERLVDEAADNARELVGTDGYFNPLVTVTLQGQLDAADQVPPTVQVTVQPGPRTVVGSVTLLLQGEAHSRPDGADQRASYQQTWGLNTGAPFTQATWDAAKAQALRGFSVYRYPEARITTSLADIDPLAHQAHLYVEMDSGAAHAYGAYQVQGAERYDAAMAQRLVRLAGVQPGQPYDATQLQAAQQRLVDSGYYTSADVVLGAADDPLQSPVEIRLREAPLQKITAGVGVSTDNGARLSLEHTHHRLPGLGWRATSHLQWEQDARTLGLELASPVDDKGWRWITGGQLQHQVDAPLLTRSQQWRLGQEQNNPYRDRRFFVQYDRAQVDNTVLGAQGTAESAVSANYTWTSRYFDNLVQPSSGYGLSVELGAGVTLIQDHQPYLRTRTRWQAYWPLGTPTATGSRLATRLEAGGVWSRDNSPVPSTQLFLAGGDNSVRGYSLRSIGVAQAGGGVTAGRWLLVGSLEWQRPWLVDGRPSALESTVFVDAGAVADRLGDLKPQVGVGAGVRYRSPVGPLQADLAYGLETRRWRLHLSVGFTF